MDPVWVIVLLLIYVVPTLIALARRTQMVVLICLLNVLLGWTIMGWSVALALAMLMPGGGTRRRADKAQPPVAAVPATVAGPPPESDFLLSPIRVVGLSLLAPVIYSYWWFWRFFHFAKREELPRARSFWWIFVPFYGWAIIGRLFHDLEDPLGPSRAQKFNAQVAVAFVVAGDVSAGWAFRLPILTPICFGLSICFIAAAIYQ